MVKKELTPDCLLIDFIKATGIFSEGYFAEREIMFYTPLGGSNNDIGVAAKQLHMIDPEFAFPVLFDYVKLAVAYLLVGHKMPNLDKIKYTSDRHIVPNNYLRFVSGQDIEVFDVAEALDDLVLYSVQLGAEYLHVLKVVEEHLEEALTLLNSRPLEKWIRRNFSILKQYVQRIPTARWYKHYMIRTNYHPNIDRVYNDNVFEYAAMLKVDDMIDRYDDILACLNANTMEFLDDNCL